METNLFTENAKGILNLQELLAHWQGHRTLTRRAIEAFPEDKLFSFSIGGMRPFAGLLGEMIDIADKGIEGMVSGNWDALNENDHTEGRNLQTKDDFLAAWDNLTVKINQLWPQLTCERLEKVEKAFGLYEAPNYGSLLYFIDNEIHHRGQAYVYLRALNITPPPFWERW